MALLDGWLDADLFSALRDKFNAVKTALNLFGGGTANKIWTKDSGNDFDGSWKTPIAATLPGLTLAGNARKIVRLNEAENALELYAPLSGFVDIPTQGAGFITLSTTTFVNLNNGSGTSLLYTFPNDNITRKFYINAVVAYENSTGQSVAITRISSNNVALMTSLNDLRGGENDTDQLQYIGSFVCTGQVIRVDAKLQNPATQNAYTFNGGTIAVIELP